MFSTRSGAAKLALGVVIGLVAIKVVVAVLGGSISIAAQAVDSFLDLFAIGITVFAVAMASMPADDEQSSPSRAFSLSRPLSRFACSIRIPPYSLRHR